MILLARPRHIAERPAAVTVAVTRKLIEQGRIRATRDVSA